jgi:hypothetical protein
MRHMTRVQYIPSTDILVEVYRTTEGDRLRIMHPKLGIERECALRDARRSTNQLALEALERIVLSTVDAARISRDVEKAIIHLRSLSASGLEPLLGEPRADIVLLAVFEYARRGIDCPIGVIYGNAEAMKSPLLRAYMSESQPSVAVQEHPLEIVEIIGWYDGIVEALVRSADGRWMYASMLAWNPENKLRIFGLMEADDTTVADLRTLSTAPEPTSPDSWSALRDRVAMFLAQVAGQAELRLCEELDGIPKATVKVDAGEIAEIAGQDADQALDGARFAKLQARFSERAETLEDALANWG